MLETFLIKSILTLWTGRSKNQREFNERIVLDPTDLIFLVKKFYVHLNFMNRDSSTFLNMMNKISLTMKGRMSFSYDFTCLMVNCVYSVLLFGFR